MKHMEEAYVALIDSLKKELSRTKSELRRTRIDEETRFFAIMEHLENEHSKDVAMKAANAMFINDKQDNFWAGNLSLRSAYFYDKKRMRSWK